MSLLITKGLGFDYNYIKNETLVVEDSVVVKEIIEPQIEITIPEITIMKEEQVDLVVSIDNIVTKIT
jgi:hypothetical protein